VKKKKNGGGRANGETLVRRNDKPGALQISASLSTKLMESENYGTGTVKRDRKATERRRVGQLVEKKKNYLTPVHRLRKPRPIL